MDNFYVYLPSNVKSIYFENTSTNYKTKLFKRLLLNHSFEVGLAEFIYTYRIFNISSDEKFKFKYIGDGKIDFTSLTLKKGYYKMEELVETLNRLLSLYSAKMEIPVFSFFVEDTVEKIKITSGLFRGAHVFVEMTENLCNILGINKFYFDNVCNNSLDFSLTRMYHDEYLWDVVKENWRGKITDKLVYKADNTYNIKAGLHTMFIYCDIIKPNLVGDGNTKLIKFCEIPNNLEYGDQVHLTYSHIDYFPLQCFDFESIEIDIKDDAGINIPFNNAHNVVVLHFRKKTYKRDKYINF